MTSSPDDATLGLVPIEQVDSKYQELDVMSVSELLHAMSEGDLEVPKAIAVVLREIEKVFNAIVERKRQTP